MAGYDFRNLLLAITILMILISSSPEADSAPSSEDVANIFDKWISQHQRVYPNELHKGERFEIFKKNWEYVENFKKLANKTHTVGLNKFSDLTAEEFLEAYSDCDPDPTPISTHSYSTSSSSHTDDYDTCNESIDWTEKGYSTRPGNQTPYCGCCWAFAAVAGVEGIAQIANRDGGTRLSVQQLVDCDRQYNKGCRGGLVIDAYDYILYNRGITSAENYPYTHSEGQCDLVKEQQHTASISSFSLVPRNDENALMAAVCSQPVTARMTVTEAFQHYTGGVFAEECGTQLGHAVTIVGMGKTEDGVKYWKVMNSWGEDWGEGGYFRILRGTGKPEGHCGINIEPTAPNY